MFYGFEQGLVTVIAAADRVQDYECFYDAVSADCADLCGDHRTATLMEMLSGFPEFRRAVYIFTHPSAEQRAHFRDRYGVTILSRIAAAERQTDMLETVSPSVDPYFDPDDARTIAEIHGLDNADPYDQRTEEEKARDAEYKRVYDEAKQKGGLSGDSFGGPQTARNDPKQQATTSGEPGLPESIQVRVTDVRAHRRADGTVEIDDILAVKGLHDENARPGDPDAPDLPEGVKKVEEPTIDLAALRRPWNDGWTEQADGWRKEVTPDEFVICGDYHYTRGTRVWITPKSYFDRHKTMYPEPLNIRQLLPADLEETGPGEYSSLSRDWNHVGFDLGQRGFRHSWYLQIWLNNQ